MNVLDPDAIVLGGGVGNIEELYTLGAKEVEKRSTLMTLTPRLFAQSWVIVPEFLVQFFSGLKPTN